MRFKLATLGVAGAAVIGLVLLQGCGGGGGTSSPSPTPTAITPAVTIAPSPTNVVQAGELSLVVSVSGPSGDATPTGTVVVSSGNYASFALTLSGGSTPVNVPTALMATGSNTLTATYSGSSNYTSATGTMTVTGPAVATAPV